VPAALKSAGGRVVLDHRASLPGSGRPRLPAPSRREQASSGPRERTLLLDGHPVAAPVVDADALRDGDRGSGPCLLESPYWSAVIPRGWTWMNGELGLRLTKEKS
jgi:hypothetical protein